LAPVPFFSTRTQERVDNRTGGTRARATKVLQEEKKRDTNREYCSP
jgi:hypothetical protein